MNTLKMMTPVMLACLLTACGGGGGSGSAGSASTADTPAVVPPAATSTNTGAVSAAFVSSATSRYLLLGTNSQSYGGLTSKVQDASGAMTSVNDSVLSGATVVNEIAGDASFALGRWAKGAVTNKSGSTVLTGDNAAYHYLTYNALASLPTSGSAVCNAGSFTAPTYIGKGGNFANSGVSTGNAAIAFGTTSAVISGSINSIVNGISGSTNFTTTLDNVSPGGIHGTGNILGGGAGTMIGLGGAATNAYVIAAGYSVVLTNGARYQGVASFNCQ